MVTTLKDILEHKVKKEDVEFEVTIRFPQTFKDDKGNDVVIYSMCSINGKTILNTWELDEYEIVLKKRKDLYPPTEDDKDYPGYEPSYLCQCNSCTGYDEYEEEEE